MKEYLLIELRIAVVRSYIYKENKVLVRDVVLRR
jgi:hypothetical protein